MESNKKYSIIIRAPKGSEKIIEEIAKKENKSINELFIKAIEQKYKIFLL